MCNGIKPVGDACDEKLSGDILPSTDNDSIEHQKTGIS